MDDIWLQSFVILATVWLLYSRRSFSFRPSKPLQALSTSNNVDPAVDSSSSDVELLRKKKPLSRLTRYKQLFYQLHNLEQYHDAVLPKVESILHDLISEALDGTAQEPANGILALEAYSRHGLEQFLQDEHASCMQRWEQYNIRRKTGGGRELFKNRDDASKYIRRLAPLRLVDGAWLAHVSDLYLPLEHRQVTRKLWQILSEELGDGCLQKNHVNVYSGLLRELDSRCPSPHTRTFVEAEGVGMDDLNVWKAAVAQQLISVLPGRFMPEILGFNMHFEGIAYETLVNCRELNELGFDPCYYLLHVSIDNNHSGHSAIAIESVAEFLDRVERESGPEAVQVAWNRVRAGYMLSNSLTAATNVLRKPPPALNSHEQAVVKIIAGKAAAAQKMHCGSRTTIGGQDIDYWLDKDLFREPLWQTQFLRALSNTGSLVRRGCSADSRLIKAITWGGKMFGSFTSAETEALRKWIDALPPRQHQSYWSFTGVSVDETVYDPRVDNDCWVEGFYRETPLIKTALHEADGSSLPFSTGTSHKIAPGSRPVLHRLVPLWFAGLSLLAKFVAVPSKAANSHICAVLRVLRAQHGMRADSDGVGGLDEALRIDKVDLVDIGLELVEQAGLQRPRRLSDVLHFPDAAFARELTALAVRPEEHAELLVGLSCAFVELHDLMTPFVSETRRAALEDIAAQERQGLEQYLDFIEADSNAQLLVSKAYEVGRLELAACFV